MGRGGRRALSKLVVLAVAIPLTLLATVFAEGTAWSGRPHFTTGHGVSTCHVVGHLTFDPPLDAHATGLSTVRETSTLSGCVGPDVTQFGETITGGSQRTVGRPPKTLTNCSAPLASNSDGSATGFLQPSKVRTTWSHTGTARIPNTVATGLHNQVEWTSLSESATDTYSSSGASSVRGAFRYSIFTTPANRDWPGFVSSLHGSLTLGEVRARCLSTDPAQHIASEAFSGTTSIP